MLGFKAQNNTYDADSNVELPRSLNLPEYTACYVHDNGISISRSTSDARTSTL
jgi:hypothetical protein